MTKANYPRSKHGDVAVPLEVGVRALSHFQFIAPTGCHLSTYSLSGGYAQVGWRDGNGVGHTTTAHRAAWSAVHGPVPAGLSVDHMCKNKLCVNVEHLRLLTHFENSRRKGTDWPIGQGECINGHPASSYRGRADGVRTAYCADCVREQRRAKRRLIEVMA